MLTSSCIRVSDFSFKGGSTLTLGDYADLLTFNEDRELNELDTSSPAFRNGFALPADRT